MTYAIVSRSSQEKTVARKYLSAEQQLTLVAQVKERNELIKSKKDSLTLEEQRIRIRGERAFNELLANYRFLVWHLIKRFSISERITTDELHQQAVIAFDKAVSSYRLPAEGRTNTFGGWAFFVIRRKFLNIYHSDLKFNERRKATRQGLITTCRVSNNETPIKVLIQQEMQEEIKIQMQLAIPESLTNEQSKVFVDHYYGKVPGKNLAEQLGTSVDVIKSRNRNSRIKLKQNPRLQELAETYFA